MDDGFQKGFTLMEPDLPSPPGVPRIFADHFAEEQHYSHRYWCSSFLWCIHWFWLPFNYIYNLSFVFVIVVLLRLITFSEWKSRVSWETQNWLMWQQPITIYPTNQFQDCPWEIQFKCRIVWCNGSHLISDVFLIEALQINWVGIFTILGSHCVLEVLISKK